jgi:hypothetical protein
VLSDQPSRQHFDPERVELDTSSQGSVERAIIAHPWLGSPHLHAVAGEIRIVDRREKSVTAFTFGGDLEIQVLPSGTLVSVNSQAPLLDRQSVGGMDVESALAEECTILLAEQRAGAADAAVFEQRLARADPLALYTASLLFLEGKFSRLTISGSGLYEHSLQAVRREIGTLKANGTWPSPEPALESIL